MVFPKTWADGETWDGAAVTDLESRVSSAIGPFPNRYLAPSGGDDAAAMQAAITALGSQGSIILGPGTFQWISGVPKLPTGATGIQILGSGVGATFIELSVGAPRFIDINHTADYETAQNIEIGGFTIDDNSVGGINHLVFGNDCGGVSRNYLNCDQIYIHDINIVNVPVTNPYGTMAVRIGLGTATSAEVTQIACTNFRMERVRLAGGNMFAAIFGASGVGTTPNAWIDNIEISDCYHDLGTTPAANFAAGNIQIGQYALVGRVRISNVIAKNAADTGIEIDNAIDAVVDRCTVTDAYTYPFYATNFNITSNPNGGGADWSVAGQRVVFRDCCAYRHNLISTTSGIGRGFGIGNNSLAQGTFVFNSCHHRRTAADGIVSGEGFLFQGEVQRIVVDNCSTVIENVTCASPASTALQFYLNLIGTTDTTLKIRGLRVKATGATGGITAAYGWSGVKFDKVATGKLHLDVDDITFEVAFTPTGGGSIAALNALVIGATGGGHTYVDGTIKHLRYPAFGTYAGRYCLFLGGTSRLTINNYLQFIECDWTNGGTSSPGIELNLVGFGATNGSQCRFIDCVWASAVAPSGRYQASGSGAMTYATRIWAALSTAAPYTITMPDRAGAPPGDFFEVVDESNGAAANNIAVTCAGSDTWLGGATSKAINTNGGSLRFYNNGAVWVVA